MAPSGAGPTEQEAHLFTPGRIAAGIGILVVAAIAVTVGVVLSFGNSDRICRGVSISGVDVGDTTVGKATTTVQSWARERLTQRVVLTALDTRWSGSLADFGARIDWNRAIWDAYRIGRSGSIFRKCADVLFLHGDSKQIRADVVLNRPRLEKTLKKAAAQVNRPHRDASMQLVDGRLEIRQEQVGIKLDEKSALGTVEKAIEAGHTLVPLPVVPDNPAVVASDLRAIDTSLSNFTTSFNPGKRDRTHNLALAAAEINGVVLKPGQVFSYNSIVGPRLQARGYREAQIFVRGRLEPGLGGGVCQVSSTLYNAVLLAGLKVVERQPHSQTVPYVAPGRDATVAYGLLDFRFENSNSNPVCIISQVAGSRLRVDIYGAGADKRNISIYTSRPRYYGAGSQVVRQAGLAPGTRRVIKEGSRGATVTVYRKTTGADGQAKVDVVSRDRYPAQSTVIGVGGPRPQQAVGAVPASSTSPAAAASTN